MSGIKSWPTPRGTSGLRQIKWRYFPKTGSTPPTSGTTSFRSPGSLYKAERNEALCSCRRPSSLDVTWSTCLDPTDIFRLSLWISVDSLASIRVASLRDAIVVGSAEV